MAFGSYPLISLADARAAHTAARAQLLGGTDPMAERKAEKGAESEFRRAALAEANRDVVNSFREIAWQWFENGKKARANDTRRTRRRALRMMS